MKKVLFAFTCLCGLCGCLNMNDDSTIDESSIVITRGKIRDVYVEAYVDVEAKGLKGIDVVLPNKETGYNRIHEMGYTMIYEVYDSQGKLVEKKDPRPWQVWRPFFFFKTRIDYPTTAMVE